MDPCAAADYAHAESFALSDEAVRTVRDFMFDKQHAVMDGNTRIRALLCGRRGGKSAGIVGWVIDGALEKPGSLSVLFGLTSVSVRFYIWKEIRAWAQRLGWPDGWLSDSQMLVTLPNGAQIKCTGTDDMRTIESWRGPALYRIVIDECGAQNQDLLRHLVTDILRATMIDLGGQLALCGTPSPLMDGYWFEMTGPARKSRIPVFNWTLLDNPHIPDGEQALAEIREENGWDEDNPTYQREYMGRWCEDPGALVYPFKLERNGLDELPTKNSHGRTIGDASRWRYVVAVDPAGVGTTGLAVLAAHPELCDVFVVESSAHPAMGVAQLAQLCREKLKTYQGSRVVMDAGGLGSVHAQEFTRVHAIGVEAAEKRDKPSAIRFARDFLMAGRLKVLNGPCNDAVRSEWAVLGWDDKRLQHHPDQADHVSDSVLYGVRYLRSYVREEKPKEPEPGSIEAIEAEAERLRSARDRQVKYGQRQRRAWS